MKPVLQLEFIGQMKKNMIVVALLFAPILLFGANEKYLRGMEYVYCSDYQNAILCFRQCLDDSLYVDVALNNIGLCFKNMCEYDSALTYLTRAWLSNKNKGCAPDAAVATMNIGVVYYRKRQYEAALSRYRRALPDLQKSRDTANLINCYVNFGNLFVATGNSSKAINSLQTALRLAEQSGRCGKIGDIYTSIGRYYCFDEEHEKAVFYFNEALALYDADGDIWGMGIVYNNLAIAYYYSGELELSTFYTLKCTEISRKINDAELRAFLSEFYFDLFNMVVHEREQIRKREYLIFILISALLGIVGIVVVFKRLATRRNNKASIDIKDSGAKIKSVIDALQLKYKSKGG